MSAHVYPFEAWELALVRRAVRRDQSTDRHRAAQIIAEARAFREMAEYCERFNAERNALDGAA